MLRAIYQLDSFFFPRQRIDNAALRIYGDGEEVVLHSIALNLSGVAAQGLPFFYKEALSGKRRKVFNEDSKLSGGQTLAWQRVAIEIDDVVTRRAQCGREEYHIGAWPGVCVVNVDRRSLRRRRGRHGQNLRQQIAGCAIGVEREFALDLPLLFDEGKIRLLNAVVCSPGVLVIKIYGAPGGIVVLRGIGRRRKHRPQSFALDQTVNGGAIERRFEGRGRGPVFPVRSEISFYDGEGRAVALLKLFEHLLVCRDDEPWRDVALVPLTDEVRQRRIGRSVVGERVRQLDDFVRIGVVVELARQLHDLVIAELAERPFVKTGDRK